MKKRVIAAMLTAVLSFSALTPITASADPIVDSTTKSQYAEKEAKYNELVEKVQNLDNQISDLVIKINSNNEEIENINSEVENVNKEIEQTKSDIAQQEEVLGQRLREIYKSGGQASYLSILFSADSFSDLISKVDNAKTLINLDKKAVNELNDSKKKLDEKVVTLQDKAKEVEELNAQVKQQKEESDAKKADQETLLAQAKQEKDEFEAQYILPKEKDAVAPWISQATNMNNSSDQIKEAVKNLEALKSQLTQQSVINDTDAAITKGKNNAAEKIRQEQAQAQAQTNRGTVVPSGNNATSNNNGGAASKDNSAIKAPAQTHDASAVLDYARKFLGTPYVYGATGPNSFDCSGFTQYVFRNAAGISLGRTTYDQIKNGVEVSYSQLQPGDLVFPHDGHVGIYIGNGQMIHAPHTGDVVKISPVYKFWRGRRVL